MDTDVPGLEDYFPREICDDPSFRETLSRCEKVLTPLLPMEGTHLEDIVKEGFIAVDIYRLEFVDEQFLASLLDDPLNHFKYLGLAASLLFRRHRESEAEVRQAQPTEEFKMRKLWVECKGYREIVPIGRISPPHYGKFITISGTVAAIGKISQEVYEATFRCDTCSSVLYVLQPLGQFQAPKTCTSPKCRAPEKEKGPRACKPSFSRVKSLDHEVTSQTIHVIQTYSDPKTNEKHVDVIKVQLVNHLIERCAIMDSVTVSGTIVEPKNSEGDGICSFYMLGSSLITNPEEKFAPNALKGIQAILAEPDILGLLIASFCPSISCNNMVKLGLLFSLVGGHDSDNIDEDETVAFRGQVHTLILGAPNKEKKEILDAAHRVAPISSYVDKNYTSNIVYDVRIEKGEETLHAGPVLQANKGISCIDGLDEMKSQWSCVTEIMETQMFQVDKKSFVHSAPVDISIVASSTPVGGSYRTEKTLYENIKMPSDMLNQFDLIFHLIDEPDHQNDRTYTKKVLKRQEGRQGSMDTPTTSTRPSDTASSQSTQNRYKAPLSKRLAQIDKESIDLLPRKLFSRYIQFVRTKVFPKFDEASNGLVFEFYDEYQEKAFRGVTGSAGYPSDHQLLSSLMRLSLARARLEGKSVVEKRDVQDIIELIKYTRCDIFPKDVLSLSSQASLPGSLRRPVESSEGLVGLSRKRCRSSNERFVRYLEDYFNENPVTEFTIDELYTIARSGPPVNKFDQMVDHLNLHGYILQCGNSKYRWVSPR